nr:PREDICTED: nicalin-1 [Bemisia tabaci]
MIALDADQFAEIIKSIFPIYLILALPIFIILSPINPVEASHEFSAYRMQHFDLHGTARGCRSSVVNLEARSLSTWSTLRHCVIAHFEDLALEQLDKLLTQAGALLIILPRDFSKLSAEEKQNVLSIEKNLLLQQVQIPIYFLEWSYELKTIVRDLSTGLTASEPKKETAAHALFNSISANGYQVSINAPRPNIKYDLQIPTIQGKLSGYGVEDKLPTIVFVAHYDSFGVAPELSYGSDSNGSGVVALLELARIFSHFYSNLKTHPRFNMLFLLSGGGKINYQGSKKWLEDNIDVSEGSTLHDVPFVICLDSLGGSSSDQLYFHVSKPPKAGSPADQFIKIVKNVSDDANSIHMVHKKINLADDLLAWEHERFSIKRLPAFTVSSLTSHKDYIRSTIFDTKANVNTAFLEKSVNLLAESIAHYVFNFSKSNDIMTGSYGVRSNFIKSWVEFLSTHPRSAQLLGDKNNILVNILQESMGTYLRDVKVSYMTADKRDPEFVFYDVTKAALHIYNVKPAVFDLFLSAAIGAYLGFCYLAILKFSVLYNAIQSFSSSVVKKKVN